MKNLLIIGLALSLSACMVSPDQQKSLYTGKSVADPVLKNDVKKQIQEFFPALELSNCRKIDNIETSIVSIDTNAQGAISQVFESWNVSACGTIYKYRISLRPDAAGEVDYSVTFPPTKLK